MAQRPDLQAALASGDPQRVDALADTVALAGLPLDVYPRAERLENGYRYQVRAYDGDGNEHRVLIDNHKYADVTPFVAFLNERLEETEEERRLMLFHESDDAGVVFVDMEEAEVLSGFGHVREPE